MEKIKTVEELISSYKKLPGIGLKTAERLAYATLNLTREDREEFISALLDCDEKVKVCEHCGIFYEDKCPICSDEKRNKKKILVVSDPKDIISIEGANIYDGIYFALKNTLSIVKRRGPEEIGIDRLEKRVKEVGAEELILALPTDLDGSVTSQYIVKAFEKLNVNITQLASGIPLGTNLEYIDNMTLAQSINARRKIN